MAHEQLDLIEARARHIAGASHHRGAIPARAWRQAIAERFFGEPIRDPEWAERFLAWRVRRHLHRATGVPGMSQRHPHDYVDFGIEPELMTEDYKAYLRGYAEGRSAALAAERDRLREAAELVIAAYSMGHRKRYAALDTAIPALRAALAPGTPVDLE